MNEEPAFEFSGTGWVSAGGRDYEAEFAVVVASTGQVRGEATVPLRRGTAGDLLRVTHSNETVAPFLGLRGDTKEGGSITSNHLVLTSTRNLGGEGGSSLRLEFHVRRMDVSWHEPGSDAPEPETLEYIIPGALGFGGDKFSSPHGDVVYAAPRAKEVDASAFGRLVLQCIPGTIEEERESFVGRILEILSFAQGTELRWVVRKEFCGGSLKAMRVEPNSWPPQPGLPVFSHLNLEPVLELATTAYTEKVREEKGLRVAMTWLLMRPRYQEAEYLMGMTALEHLVSRSPATTGGTRITKTDFRERVEPPLLGALATVEGLEAEDSDFFMRKIAKLNDRPFGDRLMAILKAEGVPIADIEESIPSLAPVRNRIVHTGEAPKRTQDRSSLISLLIVLRELIVRIVLHRLGFKGQYFCRLEEVSWRSFPPEG